MTSDSPSNLLYCWRDTVAPPLSPPGSLPLPPHTHESRGRWAVKQLHYRLPTTFINASCMYYSVFWEVKRMVSTDYHHTNAPLMSTCGAKKWDHPLMCITSHKRLTPPRPWEHSIRGKEGGAHLTRWWSSSTPTWHLRRQLAGIEKQKGL